MAALLPLLAFLLVAGAGEGGLATAALSMDDATAPPYSSPSEVITYWQTMLPNSPMPSSVAEHLSEFADNNRKLTLQQCFHGEDEKITCCWGSSATENDEKTTFLWGTPIKGDDGGLTFHWGPFTEKNDGKGSLGWGPTTNGLDEQTKFQPETQMNGGDGRTTFRWGSQMEKDDGKITLQWDMHHQRDDERVTFTTNPQIKIKDEKTTLGWGPHTSQLLVGGKHIEEDNDHKVTFNWGSHKTNGDQMVTLGWGKNTNKNDGKVTHQWGPSMDEAIEKNGGDKKVTLTWRSKDKNIVFPHQGSHRKEGHHEVRGAGHNHGKFNLANLLFLEAVLTPGTLMAPYIEPSVLPAPFLRREIADAIPMSTKNFTDILSMFAPTSIAMAGKIWSTLHTCEHPHPLVGEQQSCTTSLESMVELAASVLGTRDLRAFSSSSDVPAAGFVASPSSRYKVAAVRAVTAPGEEATTMTCHGVTFPYAVFYCHAVNPTRVYQVTLQMTEEEEDGAAAAGKKTMQVLAVCHLDTSQFDPENPFFVARGLKPGDAAVCHFLSRDSVLWAPAASTTQGHGQVAAQ